MENTINVKFLDTTLRDGQQCPGAAMTFEENLEYARLAAELSVDVLEAGFPAASKHEYEIVRAIADEAKPDGPIIAALCQLREEQVQTTIQAIRGLANIGKARLHTYIPVDPRLMQASLGEHFKSAAELSHLVFKLVKMAKNEGLEVQFSPEGYSRMAENFDLVSDLFRAAIEAGASILNCPDTIGGSSPLQGNAYFVEDMNRHEALISREYPETNITWSVHCHNDFGLAVWNSIQAVVHGPARQIEGCINGVGERAGNASIEQCAMILKQFKPHDRFGNQLSTKLVTQKLQGISNFIATHMLPRQPHSPIVGENAIRHSSGGHTNAILKNLTCYQPFDPKDVGRYVELHFGPASGGNHAKAILEKRGEHCDDSEKRSIAQFVKDKYKDRRKGITDDEFMEGYFEYRRLTIRETGV